MKRLHARPVAYVVVVVALFVLMAPNVQGGDLTGTGPDFPMSPSGEWVAIEPGAYHWYAFTYDADETYGPIEIKLYSTPAGAAVLTLRNGEQADLWRAQGKHESFGVCTPAEKSSIKHDDEDKDDDEDENGKEEDAGKEDYALWAAKPAQSGTYYMVVEHARNVSGTAYYRIEMTGDGFSFLGEPAPATAPAPVKAVAAETGHLAGTGPDNAQPVTDEWITINPGEYHWYYFDYSRDSKTKNEDLIPVEIKIYSEPAGAAQLTVRNGDDANAWRRDGTHQSFGACTGSGVDKDGNGVDDYGVWYGKLCASGRYYVVVEHSRNSTVPASYRIVMR
jgi:hypothetical protein